jgi:hypothetical protein
MEIDRVKRGKAAGKGKVKKQTGKKEGERQRAEGQGQNLW